jgi:hypothetical protein
MLGDPVLALVVRLLVLLVVLVLLAAIVRRTRRRRAGAVMQQTVNTVAWLAGIAMVVTGWWLWRRRR